MTAAAKSAAPCPAQRRASGTEEWNVAHCETVLGQFSHVFLIYLHIAYIVTYPHELADLSSMNWLTSRRIGAATTWLTSDAVASL